MSNDRKNRIFRAIRDNVLSICIIWLLWVFITTLIVQPFTIPSESMESTLMKNDKILVERFDSKIHRGDIVVFHDPGNWEGVSNDNSSAIKNIAEKIHLSADGSYIVKRIIGMGGDTVQCDMVGAKIKVNGQEVNEKYIKADNLPCQNSFKVTVPKNSLWLMGDNRSRSADSSYHYTTQDGKPYFVPTKNVVGKVFFKFSFNHWDFWNHNQYISNDTDISKIK